MRAYTKDHTTVRDWAVQRGGQPARVRGASGVLRIAFDEMPRNWEAISWEQYFAEFDAGELVFMYESNPSSRICKTIRAVLTEEPGVPNATQ